jgi:hypothetical protein
MHREFATAQVDDRHVLADPPEGAAAVADLVETSLAAGELAFGTGPG